MLRHDCNLVARVLGEEEGGGQAGDAGAEEMVSSLGTIDVYLRVTNPTITMRVSAMGKVMP